MRKTKKVIGMILIVCMIFTLGACGSQTKKYLGTWVGQAGGVLILNKDKTCKYQDGGDDDIETGTWRIEDGVLIVTGCLKYDIYAELGQSESSLLFEADSSRWKAELFIKNN